MSCASTRIHMMVLLFISLDSHLARAVEQLAAGDEAQVVQGPFETAITTALYNRLICYAISSDWPRRSPPKDCEKYAPYSVDDVRQLLEEQRGERCRSPEERGAAPSVGPGAAPGCVWRPSIDWRNPVVVFVGLGNVNRIRVISGALAGAELKRSGSVSAVYITDASDSHTNSVEVTVARSQRSLSRRAFYELPAAESLALAGADDPCRAIAIGVAVAPIPFKPASILVTFTRLNVYTSASRSTSMTLEAPTHRVTMELGVFLPFKEVQFDRYYIRQEDQTLARNVQSIEFYVSYALRFEFVAERLSAILPRWLQGPVRDGFPSVVIGLGMPVASSRFWKTNSWYLGAAFPLGRSPFRLSVGRQFAELQLSSALKVGEAVPEGFRIGDVTERARFSTFLFGVSVSLPVFGR